VATRRLGAGVAVSFAGYFFYLIRRASRSNVLNSIVHGLFDFSIISAAGISTDEDPYPGGIAPMLVYVIVAIVLLVRRHKIEPDTTDDVGEGDLVAS
jgi:uncharacterized protein